MRYKKIIELKDGRRCCLRNAEEEDGQAVLDNFLLTHRQTDNLATYADEITLTVEQEKAFLKNKAESAIELEHVSSRSVIHISKYKSIICLSCSSQIRNT